ncbi:MAG: outer membrane receptor for ferrienterochelin and colicins [Colwellia sp.]|jgi:outer membrane receptor for ferrienterochelin and colicins
MLFTRSILTLSLMAAFAIHSPLLLASNDFNDNSTQIDNNEFADDFDDSLEDFYGDEEFVSIATGNKVLIHKAPAITTVITRKEIENSSATHLDELLQRVPGLHSSFSSISRNDPIYSIRGIQTGFNPQILVLLNGIEFKNSFSGGLPYTFHYSLENVERVEVIRGPGSALYGADAFSGVINIITKQVEGSQTTVGGRIGSFNSYDFWVQAENKFDNGSWRLSVEKQASEGDDERIAEADLQTSLDTVFGTNTSLAPSPLDGRYDTININTAINWHNWQWENWYWEQSDGGLGPGGAQVIDPTGYQDVNLYRSVLKFEDNITDLLKVKSHVSWMKTTNDTFFTLFPKNTVLPIGSDGNINFSDVAGIVKFTEGYIGNPKSVQEDFRFHLSMTWSGWTGHNFTGAIGYSNYNVEAKEYKNFGPGIIDGTQPIVDGTLTNVTGTPFIYIPDESRQNSYALLQDAWVLTNDLELTLGIRYDNYSDFGSSVNPRAALVWQANHNLTAKVLYGSAFRAPSFNEMFLINNPSALGNPDVKPEEIDTWEVALEYKPSFDVRLAVNIYQYEATNLIDKVPSPEGLRTANVRDQNGYGLESEIEWKIQENLFLYANYSWQHSENKLTGKKVADAPEQLFYLDITYHFNNDWQLGTQFWWVGDRIRAEVDTRDNIDTYAITNIKLSWQLLSSTKLIVTAKNIMDESAAEPSNGRIVNDYQREGRSLWIAMEYNF